MPASILNPKDITDDSGERVAVILTIAEFKEITDLLDDLDDAAELECRRSEVSISHEEAMMMIREDREIPD